MPTLNPLYISLPPLQEAIFNKDDGTLLAGGSVTFYEDTNRSVLKPVYQLSLDPSNEYVYNPLVNPMTLSSIGTFQDGNGNNIVPLLYPYDSAGNVQLYYVEVKDADGVLQFTVEHYPQSMAADASDITESSDNQISNPQFVQVLFTVDSTGYYSQNVSGTDQAYEIAPGWSVITSGTGSFRVKQVEVLQIDAPSNPPYALEIRGSGSLTALKLRQTLSNSPRLFANGVVGGSFVCASQDSGSHVISMAYTPYASGTSYTIVSGSTLSSTSFKEIKGAVETQSTINTSGANSGGVYIDIIIAEPLASVQISSVQLVAADAPDAQIAFLQESSQRQIDHLFHFYNPFLQYKPIPSLLTGWDFPLNPAQWGENQTITTTASYIWDQTIGKSTVANVAVMRQSASYGSLEMTTTAANESVMVMQYLTGNQARKLISSPVSVNVQGYSLTGSVTARVYLIRAPAATTIPTLGTIPGTLNADGTFTNLIGNWAFVEKDLGDEDRGVLPVNASAFNLDLKFGTWTDTAIDTDKVAIVVTFVCPTISTTILLQSISLTPGQIPTRPAPQTPDEVLRECQYYYEQSYESGVVPGSNTPVGQMTIMMDEEFSATVNQHFWYRAPFTLTFQTPKRLTPTSSTLKFYTPTGTVDNMKFTVYLAGTAISTGGGLTFSPSPATTDVAANSWTYNYSTKRISTLSTTGNYVVRETSGSNPVPDVSGVIEFHYVVDVRLGKA